QVGLQTGAFIELPLPTEIKIGLWGTVPQVQAAKEKLRSWYSNSTKSALKEYWAKVYAAPSDRLRRVQERDHIRKAYLQRLRQDPRESDDFPVIGFFLWPIAEFTPDAVLGSNSEALDPIRTENECYIKFDRGRSLFKILSHSQTHIEGALAQIRVTISEIVTRHLVPTKLYLLEPPRLPDLVKMEVAFSHSNTLSFRETEIHGKDVARVIPLLEGAVVGQTERNHWEIFQPSLDASNEHCIRRALIEVLTNMRFYRGLIKIRAHFGIMSFETYKRPTEKNHSLQDFTSMIKNSQTVGELLKDLGNEERGAALISRCCENNELLYPIDATAFGLEDTAPDYTVSFELETRDKIGSVRLDLDFVEANTGNYVSMSHAWYKLENTAIPRNGTADVSRGRSPLDVNMIDLFGKAWQIAITTSNVVDPTKVTHSMEDFAKNVRLTKSTQGASTEYPSVDFKYNDIIVKCWVERTSFKYFLHGCRYILEITRLRRFRKDATAQKIKAAVSWEASVYDPDWDAVLGGQRGLKIGHAGNWSPHLKTFFPTPPGVPALDITDGFEDFLSKVKAVSRFVADFRAEVE
ncbi:MAG: hypothetical protein M1837_001902, partial [Sclerophora amabilis]